jgi:hypothetical protein
MMSAFILAPCAARFFSLTFRTALVPGRLGFPSGSSGDAAGPAGIPAKGGVWLAWTGCS